MAKCATCDTRPCVCVTDTLDLTNAKFVVVSADAVIEPEYISTYDLIREYRQRLTTITAERDRLATELVDANRRLDGMRENRDAWEHRYLRRGCEVTTLTAERDEWSAWARDLFPTLVVLAHDEGQRVLAPELLASIRKAVATIRSRP